MYLQNTLHLRKSNQFPQKKRILRLYQLASNKKKGFSGITGMSRSTILKQVELGLFPQPIRIGKRAIGWTEDNINEWIESREVLNHHE